MLESDKGDVSVDARDSKIPHANAWAWGLCWLMFASTVLNYMDRQTITLVKDQIATAFAIKSDVDFGWILAAFSMTYALFQVPAGYLVDRWDLRWSYAAAVAWWSLAAMAIAVVPSLGMLIACRALLGVGESFNWPCALRVTARVLPPADRSLGNGIFNSGAAVGAVVTPFVVTNLTLLLGWRSAFLVIGSLGFVWVAAWLILVQGPERRLLAREPRPKPAEIADELTRPGLSSTAQSAFSLVLLMAIGVGLAAFWRGLSHVWLSIALLILGPLAVACLLPLEKLKGADWAVSLGEIVRIRRFWVLVVVSVSINICWHVLINWTPTYLKDERGLAFQAGNFLSAIPFLAADVGNLGGGWLSRLVRRSRTHGRSRTANRDVIMHSAHRLRHQREHGPKCHDRRAVLVGHGRRHGRLHGKLFRVYSGSQFTSYGTGCGLSGRNRQSVRRRHSTGRGFGQGSNGEFVADFLADRNGAGRGFGGFVVGME